MWLLEIESRLGWECLPAVSSFDTLTPFTEGSGYLNSGPHSCTAFSKEPSAAQLPFFFLRQGLPTVLERWALAPLTFWTVLSLYLGTLSPVILSYHESG